MSPGPTQRAGSKGGETEAQELLDKCHPLGRFEGLAALAVASSMRELYRLVLVDTPLAPYFAEELTAGKEKGEEGNRYI